MTEQQLAIAIAIGVALLVVLIVIVAVVTSRRRKERAVLRERYGEEYERTVRERGGKQAAVRDFRERESLRSQLQLNDLQESDRSLVRRHMATLQFRFVEDPADVILQTERITTEVLRARGYPVAENRDKALRLFSVDYPAEAVHVRTVVLGDHGGDVARMRDAFLGVRRALEDIAGVVYSAADATDDLGRLRHGDNDAVVGMPERSPAQPPASTPPAGAPTTASSDEPTETSSGTDTASAPDRHDDRDDDNGRRR